MIEWLEIFDQHAFKCLLNMERIKIRFCYLLVTSCSSIKLFSVKTGIEEFVKRGLMQLLDGQKELFHFIR